jgi:hypothetical protein
MTTSHCPPPEGGPASGRGVALAGIATLASLFLAACGGDGYSSTPPPPPPPAITQVPASAAASDLALETFAFNLARTDDTEPLTLELVPTLPSSETDDPVPTP